MRMEAFPDALARVLRPLVRLMIGRGIGYRALSDALRRDYVRVAARDVPLEGRRLTDSRLSLLTGLERREIKALRAELAEDRPVATHGPLPRVLTRWQTDPAFLDGQGAPRVLARQGGEAGFDGLVRATGLSLHPRTVLDEALRLSLVTLDGDGVALTARAMVPAADDAAMLGYLGANLGDHAEAAVANLEAAGRGETPPFFERAVHYNRLSAAALAELDAMARRLGDEALRALNARAATLQARDGGDGNGADGDGGDDDGGDGNGGGDPPQGRFRAGVYVFRDGGEP
ncbi:MAG: DUF6502 family protein [Pseudomonadota bacterium]